MPSQLGFLEEFGASGPLPHTRYLQPGHSSWTFDSNAKGGAMIKLAAGTAVTDDDGVGGVKPATGDFCVELSRAGNLEAWHAPLSAGRHAIAFVNRSPAPSQAMKLELLKRGAEMMYVPDATVHTVERIEAEWIHRASQNLLRWSGNMLRNGSRAIAIGPKKMGFFIWWCIIDQRIAMWTCLAGPIAVIFGAFLWTPMLLLALPPWVLFTRAMLSMLLYYHHRSIDPLFPFILYANQIGSSILKIYILFRLPMQRWANRGDQRAFSEIDWSLKLKTWMANYITLLWCAAFVFAVVHYTGVVSTPLEVYAVKLLDFLL